jgi:hypothetical protein
VSITPATQSVPIGGTATWTVSITNDGGAYLYATNATDPAAPDCDPPSSDSATLYFFAPHLTETYTCTLANVTEGLTNTITATTVTAPGAHLSATASAQVVVEAPPPPAPAAPVSHAGGHATAATVALTGIRAVVLSDPTPSLEFTVELSRATVLVLTLTDGRHHRLASWVMHRTAGRHTLVLLLGRNARKQGHDTLSITHTGSANALIRTIVLTA